jgi:hypothetical protein
MRLPLSCFIIKIINLLIFNCKIKGNIMDDKLNDEKLPSEIEELRRI